MLRQSPSKKGRIISWPVLLALICAVVGIAAAIISFYLTSIAHQPAPAPLSVNFTSPAEGSAVSQQVIVQGTAANIPQNEELWLFIKPEGATGYFPQAGPINISSDGKWSAAANIGQQGLADVGKKFELIPALVDQNNSEAKDAIQAYFNQTGPVYKGIEPLPIGIQLMSSVSVVRK